MFTQDQYHQILTLLQHSALEPPSASLAAASFHVSLIPRAVSHSLPSHIETSNQSIVLSCTCDPSPFGDPWIPDFGATDHICVSLAYFTSFFKTRPTHIKLPNGTMVTASYCGTITFTKTLTLTNFLFVPNFTYNFLSISQLTQASKCSILFLPNRCFIQYMKSWRMIGSVDRRMGCIT